MLLDPSWLLRKDRLDRHTMLPKKILEIFPFQGALNGRLTNIHEILMRLRSVQIHPLSFLFSFFRESSSRVEGIWH